MRERITFLIRWKLPAKRDQLVAFQIISPPPPPLHVLYLAHPQKTLECLLYSKYTTTAPILWNRTVLKFIRDHHFKTDSTIRNLPHISLVAKNLILKC